ncbi:hypothetical protein KEM52_003248 [Ascosphaera acerosa]|nr:hypothetical protein KEM52_003248 [Ascosphaera acerosa]
MNSARTWGFGNLAMGPPTAQHRVGSFSQQGLGAASSQMATPLDMSRNICADVLRRVISSLLNCDREFPSLSGAPGGQTAHAYPAPGQAIWAKAAQQPSVHQQQQHDNLLRLSQHHHQQQHQHQQQQKQQQQQQQPQPQSQSQSQPQTQHQQPLSQQQQHHQPQHQPSAGSSQAPGQHPVQQQSPLGLNGEQRNQQQQHAGLSMDVTSGTAASQSPVALAATNGLTGQSRESQDIRQTSIPPQLLPLYSTFTSPFAPANATVPPMPEYTLPACYNVANVQPLQSRMTGFSNETLFYIFYSMPRDIMQEFAAEELMARKWRYHKVKRLWLTRDESYPNPVEVERGVSERGIYCWWDATTWKKVRRDFVLRYADLDNHLEPGRGMIQYGQS